MAKPKKTSPTVARLIGNLSKRHSAPARKQAIILRARATPTTITQTHVIKTEKL